jgi:hypothetical protein
VPIHVYFFRCIIVPKKEARNHVILLRSLMPAIKEVIGWTLQQFKKYYGDRNPASQLPPEQRKQEDDTQVYEP